LPNRIFFFSDIDDTLIQTRRKTDFKKKTVVGAYNKEGEENSFFYEGVKVFVDTIIDSNITFIPTTARNLDSYKRTVFYEKNLNYVILNFGGMILLNNKIDEEWSSRILEQYSKIESLKSVYEKLAESLEKYNLVIKIIDDFYISIYNKFALDNKEILKNLRTELNSFTEVHNDFYIYENDNSFGILPNFLNKKFAVDYLIEKENPILTIGAGDNSSDLDFMNSTSFHFTPINSNILKDSV